MDFFSFVEYVGITHLVSGFLTEDIVPFVAVDLVCPWEEVSLGSSEVAVLDPLNNCSLIS